MFFNVVSLMAARRKGVAFGPVVACRRADYVAAGGHAAVRADVVEDVALARRFGAAAWFAGRGVVEFRMYPDGAAGVARGFAKNIARGAMMATSPWRAALAVLWIGALASMVVSLPAPWALAAYPAVVVQLAVLGRRVGRYHWWAMALWPVTLAFFVVVCAASLVVRRPVWKGRPVAARPA